LRVGWPSDLYGLKDPPLCQQILAIEKLKENRR